MGLQMQHLQKKQNETDQYMDEFYHLVGYFVFCQKVCSRIMNENIEKEKKNFFKLLGRKYNEKRNMIVVHSMTQPWTIFSHINESTERY